MTMKSTTPSYKATFITDMVALATAADGCAENAWLSDYRHARIAELAQASFPHAKIEHFKYNRLDDFDKRSFNRLAVNSHAALHLPSRQIEGLEGETPIARVVLVNGYFSSELSHLDGHCITPFADTNAEQQDKILAQLQAQSSLTHNPFAQVGASLLDRGVLIEVHANSPATPIEVLSIMDGDATDSTVASHVIVDIADNSAATLISRALNWDFDSAHVNFSTQHTLVSVGQGARCTHYALQLDNANSLYFGTSEYHLQSRATLDAFYGGTGSLLKKLDITVNHLGEYAHANLNGLFAATDEQQIDYHTTINHPLPNGETDEVFRGIVNGKAEATFNGRIHIFEDAQKTRAELSNKNLILSDEAQIHTKPELEIYADDVVCAHGATVSRMDGASLNYLRARAIPKEEAELMLSYGFLNEVLDMLEHQVIADYLRPILFKRFD